MMKKSLKILAVLAAICGILLIVVFLMSIKMENELKNLKYYEVDLQDLKDGTYQGRAETTFLTVELAVEVFNHKISRIDILKHDNGLGEKAEAIVEDMVKQNTYDVDAISGATSSSQVIKSAVSYALGAN